MWEVTYRQHNIRIHHCLHLCKGPTNLSPGNAVFICSTSCVSNDGAWRYTAPSPEDIQHCRHRRIDS